MAGEVADEKTEQRKWLQRENERSAKSKGKNGVKLQ